MKFHEISSDFHAPAASISESQRSDLSSDLTSGVTSEVTPQVTSEVTPLR